MAITSTANLRPPEGRAYAWDDFTYFSDSSTWDDLDGGAHPAHFQRDIRIVQGRPDFGGGLTRTRGQYRG